MHNEYSTRSNLLESVAIDVMETRLDKMVVIRMESRQRERNQKVKAGYMKRIKQALVLRR